VKAAGLLLVGLELANAGFELVNSLEQHCERLLVHSHGIGRLLCAQTGRGKSQPTSEEEQEIGPASFEEPRRASMIGRSKDEEVHCFLLQNKNAHAPSACEHQSTTRRSPRTTERLCICLPLTLWWLTKLA
jgi:hypothetical protein